MYSKTLLHVFVFYSLYFICFFRLINSLYINVIEEKHCLYYNRPRDNQNRFTKYCDTRSIATSVSWYTL